MTVKQVREELAKVGVVIRREVGIREYRVNIRGGEEATAYYTEDLEDALKTGLHMGAARTAAVQKVIQEAITRATGVENLIPKELSAEFGLVGYPGKVFRVNRAYSYVDERGVFNVVVDVRGYGVCDIDDNVWRQMGRFTLREVLGAATVAPVTATGVN